MVKETTKLDINIPEAPTDKGDSDSFKERKVAEYQKHLAELYTLASPESKEVQELESLGRLVEGENNHAGKITYRVINNREVNAFAVGTTVYVFSGLLAALKDRAEIAGVLAHEIGHIENGDTMREFDGIEALVDRTSINRIQEYKADAVAHKLSNAGFDPMAYDAVMRFFADRSNGVGEIHGDTRDRQSLYRAQMQTIDFEGGEFLAGDVLHKSDVWTNAYIKDTWQSTAFDRIRIAMRDTTIRAELDVLGVPSLLILYNELQSDIEQKASILNWIGDFKDLETVMRRRKLRASIKDNAKLLVHLDVEIMERITLQNPLTSNEERVWIQSIVMTEGMGRQLSWHRNIDEAISQYTNIEHNNMPMLLNSISSKEDVLAYIRLAYSSEQTMKGITLPAQDTQHPSQLLDSYMGTRTQRLCTVLIKKVQSNLANDPEETWKLFVDIVKATGAPRESVVVKEWSIIEIGSLFTEMLVELQAKNLPSTEAAQRVAPIMVQYQNLLRQIGVTLDVDDVIKNMEFYKKSSMQEEFVMVLRQNFIYSDKAIHDKVVSLREANAQGDAALQEILQTFTDGSDLESFIKLAGIEAIFPEESTRKEFIIKVFEYIRSIHEPTDTEMRALYVVLLRRARSMGYGAWRQSEMKKDSNSSKEGLQEIGIGITEARTLLAVHSLGFLYGNEQFDRSILSALPISDMSTQVQAIVLDSVARSMQGTHLGYIYDDEDPLVLLRDGLAEELSSMRIDTAFARVRTLLYLFASGAQGSLSQISSAQFDVQIFLIPLKDIVMQCVTEMNLDEVQKTDWAQLHSIVNEVFGVDPRERTQIHASISKKVIPLMNFDQATNYLKRISRTIELPFSAVDFYQEHLVQTPKQREIANSIGENLLEKVSTYGDARVAGLVGIDLASEHSLRYSLSQAKLLKAALESKDDDTNLRIILGRLWEDKILSNFSYKISEAGMTPEKLIEENFLGGKFIPFDEFVDAFYETLTETDIDVALRKMLLSPSGALVDHSGRNILHTVLTSNIDTLDAELASLVSSVMKGGLSTVDPVRLYKPIADVLRTKIFVKPQEPGNNKKAVEAILSEKLYQYSALGILDTLKIRRRRDMTRKMFEYNPNKNRDDMGGSPLLKGLSDSEATAAAKKNLREQFLPKDRIQEKGTIDPMRLLLATAQSMGAVGVRFLQLLAQYTEIPEKYQKEFDALHDEVRGQLKFTAMETLRREAQSDSAAPELKDFWEGMESLSATIGGGSLMTVYVATMKDRSKKVVKVLNPNAEGFIEENVQDARKILVGMTKSYPFAELLLTDLDAWLRADINSHHKTGSIDEFAQLHPDRNVMLVDGTEVRVATPKVIPTGSKYIMIEEFIDGENLSALIDGGDKKAQNYQEAVALHYEEQLITFADDGKTRAHADMHAGNIRIDKKGTLYLIDRGYYIECTQEEIEIVEGFLTGEVTLDMCKNAIGYLLKLPENSALKGKIKYAEFLLRAGANLFRLLHQISRGVDVGSDAGNKALIGLRKAGLHIPMRFTLLVKNKKALEAMKKRVRGL